MLKNLVPQQVDTLDWLHNKHDIKYDRRRQWRTQPTHQTLQFWSRATSCMQVSCTKSSCVQYIRCSTLTQQKRAQEHSVTQKLQKVLV